MIKTLINSLSSELYDALEGIKYLDSDMVEIKFCVERESKEYVNYTVNVVDDGNYDAEVKHTFESGYESLYVDKEDIKFIDKLDNDIHFWSLCNMATKPTIPVTEE